MLCIPTDLVIGAVESQAVFVIRSHPVANIEVDVASDTETVLFGSKECVLNENPTIWYRISFIIVLVIFYSSLALM